MQVRVGLDGSGQLGRDLRVGPGERGQRVDGEKELAGFSSRDIEQFDGDYHVIEVAGERVAVLGGPSARLESLGAENHQRGLGLTDG